jgi:putative transposase
MQDKNDMSEQFPKGFIKQFKSKESFQEYFNSLFRQVLSSRPVV